MANEITFTLCGRKYTLRYKESGGLKRQIWDNSIKGLPYISIENISQGDEEDTWHQATVEINYSAADASRGETVRYWTYCLNNGEDVTAYEDTFTISDLPEGSHDLKVKLFADNLEIARATESLSVKKKPFYFTPANKGSIAIPAANEDGTGYVRVYDWNESLGDWLERGRSAGGNAGSEGSDDDLSYAAFVCPVKTTAESALVNSLVDDELYLNHRAVSITGSHEPPLCSAVALSSDGNTLIVGCRGWTPEVTIDHGAPAIGTFKINDHGRAYVLDWNGSSWVQRGSPLCGNLFTNNLYTHDDGPQWPHGDSGHHAPGGDAYLGYFQGYQNFGYSVDISSDGNTIAVGAYGWREDFGVSGHYSNYWGCGRVYIYKWNSSIGNWVSEKGYPNLQHLTGTDDHTEFGRGVSIDPRGDRVLCGAPYYPATTSYGSKDKGYVQGVHNGLGAGSYRWDGGDMLVGGYDYDADGFITFIGHELGWQIDISARRIQHRWLYNDNDDTIDHWVDYPNLPGYQRGHNSIFCVSSAMGSWGGDWDDLTNRYGDGWSYGANQSGKVQIYTRNETFDIATEYDIDKSQVLLKTIYGIWGGDKMDACRISADGNTVICGAFNGHGPDYSGGGTSDPHFGVRPGYAFVWRSDADWTEPTYNDDGSFKKLQMGQVLYGEEHGDYFGYGVTISPDGTSIAVSAPYATGGGVKRGCVYIYDWDGDEWKKRGRTLWGVSLGDEFGKSSISFPKSTPWPIEVIG